VTTTKRNKRSVRTGLFGIMRMEFLGHTRGRQIDRGGGRCFDTCRIWPTRPAERTTYSAGVRDRLVPRRGVEVEEARTIKK